MKRVYEFLVQGIGITEHSFTISIIICFTKGYNYFLVLIATISVMLINVINQAPVVRRLNEFRTKICQNSVEHQGNCSGADP